MKKIKQIVKIFKHYGIYFNEDSWKPNKYKKEGKKQGNLVRCYTLCGKNINQRKYLNEMCGTGYYQELLKKKGSANWRTQYNPNIRTKSDTFINVESVNYQKQVVAYNLKPTEDFILPQSAP